MDPQELERRRRLFAASHQLVLQWDIAAVHLSRSTKRWSYRRGFRTLGDLVGKIGTRGKAVQELRDYLCGWGINPNGAG